MAWGIGGVCRVFESLAGGAGCVACGSGAVVACPHPTIKGGAAIKGVELAFGKMFKIALRTREILGRVAGIVTSDRTCREARVRFASSPTLSRK